jgi:Ribbon-helix-helix protein, copG family
MAQQALDPNGGESPMLGVRVLQEDAARLARLAARRRVSRSQVARELLRFALDAIDQGEDRTIRKTRKAQGHHTPGLPNADYQRHQLESDDRNPACPNIGTKITAPTGT